MSIVSGTVGAVMGSEATESAAETSANASNYAANIQMQMFNKSLANYAPFLQLGTGALSRYKNLMNTDLMGYASGAGNTLGQMRNIATNYENSDLYKYQLQDMQTSVNRSLSAAGLSSSGRGLEIMRDSTNRLAASEAANKFSRLSSLFSADTSYAGTLANLNNAMYNRSLDAVKIGAGAAGSAGQAGITTGQGIAATTMAGGNNIASLQLSNAANWGGMAGNMSSGIRSGLQTYNQLSGLFGNSGVGITDTGITTEPNFWNTAASSIFG